MEQKGMQCFESECGKAKIFVENDMSLGSLHDFLMALKSNILQRMIDAHKKQQEMSDHKKEE